MSTVKILTEVNQGSKVLTEQTTIRMIIFEPQGIQVNLNQMRWSFFYNFSSQNKGNINFKFYNT